jgi:hypothetical protein
MLLTVLWRLYTVGSMNDDIEKRLRQYADEAILGVVVASAAEHMKKLTAEIDAGKLTWIDAKSPPGSRGFDGTSPSYKVIVVQYNTGKTIDHSGMMIVMSGVGVNIVTLPKPFANWVYHKAQATRN